MQFENFRSLVFDALAFAERRFETLGIEICKPTGDRYLINTAAY